MTRAPTRIMLVGLVLAASLGVPACSKKGATGARCASQGDCQGGHFCEDATCKAGPEDACSYLLRCIPRLSRDQTETLFNADFRQLLKQNPSELACEAKLKVLMAANRMVVLSRACGTQVTRGP